MPHSRAHIRLNTTAERKCLKCWLAFCKIHNIDIDYYI